MAALRARIIRGAADAWRSRSRSPPASSTSEAAIFTQYVKASRIIRQVMLRMQAILNYVIPY